METKYLSILFVALSSASFAYEVPTHRRLSERAAELSRIADFAAGVLHLEPGQLVAGRTLSRWIQEGSDREDDHPRYLNHFHDPHRAWSSAGLKSLGTSSVVWAQNQAGRAPEATWATARYYFYLALTSETAALRDADLAEAFLLLGHQIHFIQDAGVTAHTRDDAHPALLFDPEPLETHVDAVLQNDPEKFDRWVRDPVRPDRSLARRRVAQSLACYNL